MNEPLEDQIRRLPTPQPPAVLVERVRRLAHLELASRADERLNRLVLVFLLLFSWTLALVGFLAARVVAAGTISIAGLASLQGSSFNWPLAYFAAAWISGAAFFVLIGLHARRQRRMA
jgi:hypothetical protein